MLISPSPAYQGYNVKDAIDLVKGEWGGGGAAVSQIRMLMVWKGLLYHRYVCWWCGGGCCITDTYVGGVEGVCICVSVSVIRDCKTTHNDGHCNGILNEASSALALIVYNNNIRNYYIITI